MIWFAVALALQSPCTGATQPIPVGAVYTGQVTHVHDGDGLWLITGEGPAKCLKIRVADFYAPELAEPGGAEAQKALARLADGRQAVCTAVRGASGGTRSFDRLVAVCRVGGVSLGDAMRAAGVREGGNGSRVAR